MWCLYSCFYEASKRKPEERESKVSRKWLKEYEEAKRTQALKNKAERERLPRHSQAETGDKESSGRGLTCA